MTLTKQEIKAALNADYTHKNYAWGKIYCDGRLRL
jgi:hypothetical protein